MKYSIKSFLAATAASVALVASSQAVTVALTHQDITDAFAGGTPQSADFVFADGADSVTIRVTLSDITGSAFNVSDNGTSLINASPGGDRAYWFDSKLGVANAENPTFTATVLTSETSANVDATSIEFQINQVGMKIGTVMAGDDLVWNGSGRTSALQVTNAVVDTEGEYYALDNQFHDIDASNYVADFTFGGNDKFFQFKDRVGKDTGPTTLGLDMTVNFDVVPEPSIALLGGLGLLGLLRRRR